MTSSRILWSAALTAALLSPFAAATADWAPLLRRAVVENVQISPDGTHLALAVRTEKGTIVTLRRSDTFAVASKIEAGTGGEIGTLKWLDDNRLLVSANRTNSMYGFALVAPATYIVNKNGGTAYKLPANFVSTIDGDPDHLLVSKCGSYADGDCVIEIRRAEIGHLVRPGEKVIAAPDAHASLYVDGKGQARSAVSWDDDGYSKLYVHKEGDRWDLINDSTQSGIDITPLGNSIDGAYAYLVSERAQGPSAIERYEIATGKRTEIQRHPVSDPIATILSFDGREPIGAYYDATRPVPMFWDPQHADVPIYKSLFKAFPDSMVTVTSISRDRRKVVLNVESDVDPGAYYIYDRSNQQARLLSKSRPWLAEPLQKAESVALAARDGLTLYGLLTRPAGKATNLPMVVMPHGGPYGVLDGWGFDEETQILASQGYAVLRINFRGSAGHGRDFMERGYKQWGRAMQDDVTDATRWAIDKGYADPQRICIYGASYGAYAAMMGVVREPGLYRCAAGFAGPYDLAKMYKWGSIHRSDLGLKYLERVIGRDKADLAARSPVQQAAKIGVPVFLAHGNLDGRIDDDHAKALQRALKKSGNEAQLVIYPYAGHGLYLEKDRLDFYGKLLAFLKQNLADQKTADAAADHR